MLKTKAKLLHWAIHLGSWACSGVSCYFAAVTLLYHCHAPLLLSCGLLLSCCVGTHHAVRPFMMLLATVMMLCQSCFQPVLCYFTIVILLASVTLLSRFHATLPMAYRFTSVMLFATVMLLCQWGCLPVSCYFSVHCHTAWHCLGTWVLYVHVHATLIVSYCFAGVILLCHCMLLSHCMS